MKCLAVLALAGAAMAQVPAETSITNANGEVIIQRRQEMNTFELSSKVAALEATVASQSSQIADMMAGGGVSAVAQDMAARTMNLMSAATANTAGLAAVQGTLQTMQANVNSQLQAQAQAAAAAAAQQEAALSTALVSAEEAVEEAMEEQATALGRVNRTVNNLMGELGDAGAMINKLKGTYLVDSSIPVFKWQKFDTHQHGISWMDENRPSSFGGRHPSQWSDGNAYAWQMHSNWQYINRLFIRKGTAHQYGATICSDVFLMHSSTNGHHCGAVFRIRNTGTSSQTWRPPVTLTGWAGWGERSSVSINGQSTWQTSSTWDWQGTLNLNIPANNSRNRVTTVIFMTGSSHPWNGPSERGVALIFRDWSLRLPSGLEYVDDFDTRGTQSWKQ